MTSKRNFDFISSRPLRRGTWETALSAFPRDRAGISADVKFGSRYETTYGGRVVDRPKRPPSPEHADTLSLNALRSLVTGLVERSQQAEAWLAKLVENQVLRDEIARLKNLPPRPPFRPSGNVPQAAYLSRQYISTWEGSEKANDSRQNT